MTKLLTAILSAIIFCSCNMISGSGNIVTETRQVNQFSAVKASGAIDVEINNDNDQVVRVEADDNILPYLITKVEEGMLEIRLKSNQSYRNINVKVYVSTSSLRQLIVSGASSITSKDTITDAEEIRFKASGAGDINAFVDAPSIIAEVSGGGDINLQGRTKDLTCKVSGGADLDCKRLLSENTTATVSGGGNALVFASVSLEARASGGGDIVYSGNPQSPRIKKSGGGSVRPAN